MSCGLANASTCCLQVTLSCSVLCQIVSIPPVVVGPLRHLAGSLVVFSCRMLQYVAWMEIVFILANTLTWRFQVLLYPALQAVDLRTASYEDNSNDPYLDRRLMTTFWLCYAFADVSRFDLAAFEQNKHTSIAAKAQFSKYLVR